MNKKVLLWTMLILSVFSIVVFSSMIHEFTHYAQDDFKGNELCYMGSIKEGNISNNLIGWYKPIGNIGENVEVLPYILQILFGSIATIILAMNFFKVYYEIN